MSLSLVRPVGSIVWELRGAWATGKRVALSLDERCTPRRLEGHVTALASTGAFLLIRGFHVPTDAILAVHYPSILGDSDYEDGERWHGSPRRVIPQDEELPLELAA